MSQENVDYFGFEDEVQLSPQKNKNVSDRKHKLNKLPPSRGRGPLWRPIRKDKPSTLESMTSISEIQKILKEDIEDSMIDVSDQSTIADSSMFFDDTTNRTEVTDQIGGDSESVSNASIKILRNEERNVNINTNVNRRPIRNRKELIHIVRGDDFTKEATKEDNEKKVEGLERQTRRKTLQAIENNSNISFITYNKPKKTPVRNNSMLGENFMQETSYQKEKSTGLKETNNSTLEFDDSFSFSNNIQKKPLKSNFEKKKKRVETEKDNVKDENDPRVAQINSFFEQVNTYKLTVE